MRKRILFLTPSRNEDDDVEEEWKNINSKQSLVLM